jgi:hypothetical protein
MIIRKISELLVTELKSPAKNYLESNNKGLFSNFDTH